MNKLPWLILFLPLLAAGIITLFTRHDRKLSAGISIGAVVAGFILSVIFVYAAGWTPARPESAVNWLSIGGLKVILACGSMCSAWP
jgi:NADH:ubiquinone oxidoreductase subunit 5 (subunit L)/multisubunit Na+/H+ antiporter MnhA subunit